MELCKGSVKFSIHCVVYCVCKLHIVVYFQEELRHNHISYHMMMAWGVSAVVKFLIQRGDFIFQYTGSLVLGIKYLKKCFQIS